jgi:hypothetical protein
MSSVGVLEDAKGVEMIAVMEPVASMARMTKAMRTPDNFIELRSKYFFFYVSAKGKASSFMDNSEGELEGTAIISKSLRLLSFYIIK